MENNPYQAPAAELVAPEPKHARSYRLTKLANVAPLLPSILITPALLFIDVAMSLLNDDSVFNPMTFLVATMGLTCAALYWGLQGVALQTPVAFRRSAGLNIALLLVLIGFFFVPTLLRDKLLHGLWWNAPRIGLQLLALICLRNIYLATTHLRTIFAPK